MLRLAHILVIAALNNTLHAAISDQYNAHYSNFMTYDTKNDVLTFLSCDSIKIKRSQLNQTVRWDKDGDQIVLVKLLENPVYNDDGKYVAKLSVNEKCYTLEVKYVRKKDLTAKYALAYRLQNNENDQEFFYPGSGPIFRQSDFDREPWICNKASCIFERHVLHVSNNVEFKVLVNEKHYPMEVISNQVETNGIALHNSRITVHLRGTCSNRSIIVSYVSNDREWMIYRGEVPITGCSDPPKGGDEKTAIIIVIVVVVLILAVVPFVVRYKRNPRGTGLQTHSGDSNTGGDYGVISDNERLNGDRRRH